MSWIKVVHELPNKPEVARLATLLKIPDTDTVVGKLVRAWIWFDQHTTDGDAHVTLSVTLDRDVGVPGFTKALIKVGWLREHDDMISVVNFDRHNSKTSKNRTLAAERQSRYRNAKSNAAVDGPVTERPSPRERVRRKKIYKRKSDKPEFKSTKSKIAWPGGDQVPVEWIEEATAKKPDVDWTEEGIRFVQHHLSKGNEFKDWKAAWWTWVHGSYPKTPASPQDSGPPLEQW